jgi:hypothetical protein
MQRKLRSRRPDSVSHGTWLESRTKELAFEDADPSVVILGGGQSGLDGWFCDLVSQRGD